MNATAFVFPGQGSQAIGMLNGFAGNRVVNDTISEASDVLQLDLAALMAEGPKEALDLTTNTRFRLHMTSLGDHGTGSLTVVRAILL